MKKHANIHKKSCATGCTVRWLQCTCALHRPRRTSATAMATATVTDGSAILLFYHYERISDVAEEVKLQRQWLSHREIGGRLRIAPAGLNGTLSGHRVSLEEYAATVTARFPGSHIDWKFGAAQASQLFDSLSVRAVDEVVSLGVPSEMAPLAKAGKHVSPCEFHETLREASAASASPSTSGVVLLDARNVYESRIGHFQAAGVPTLLPPTRQFTDLPAFLDAHLDQLRGRTVLMYCTGGVRCESASAYVRHRLSEASAVDDAASSSAAATQVVQLNGGIERYFEAYPDGGFFRGKNLVFDRRLTTAPVHRAAPDVIGRCWVCEAPADDYGPQRRCFHCRLLLLLCPACCETHPQWSSMLTCGDCTRSVSAHVEDGRPRPRRRMNDYQEPSIPTPPAPTEPPQPPPPPPPDALPQRANRRARRTPVCPNPNTSATSAAAPTAFIDETLAEQPAVDSMAMGEWAYRDVPVHYEYLDHTADVQIHSWGACVEEAFQQQVVGVMGLITELDCVRVADPVADRREVSVEGHDLPSLLYNFLDEWLFQFNAEGFVCKRVKITSFDRTRWAITSQGVGEAFELGRHPQGIEVKAITYSALRVTEGQERTDVLVIVDV